MIKLLDSDKTKTKVTGGLTVSRPSCTILINLKPIFFFAFLSRDFKQEQMQIRLNLVVALAAAQIAFLSGIDALEPKVRRQ